MELRYPVLLGAVLASLLVCAGCGEPPAPAGPPPARPPTPVAATAAIARDVPVYLDEIGRCVARETVSVKSQVAGQITTVYFVDGASVAPGDRLFTIDPRPFQAALDTAQASLEQNRATLALARVQATRYRALAISKDMARETAEEKESAAAIAQAQVRSGEAALEAARLNLDYCQIRSPIQGRTGHRLRDRGNIVKSNEDTLVVIEQLDPIFAEFAVTEHEFTAVQENAKKGTLKVEVRLPDDTAPARTGDLTFVDNLVDSATGTLRLRATLANSDHHFWPGLYVNARLILSVIPRAVLVPAAAVQISAKGPFVYVIKDDETAELRTVKPGQLQGDLVVIQEGVRDGERVVTVGHLAVTPGGKVKVEKPAPAPAPSPSASAKP